MFSGELFVPDRRVPCAIVGPDLFFSESPRELETAKRLCTACPVRVQCLTGAIERAEPWGVWGGEVFVAGRPVPFKRPRGRPRKHPVAPVPLGLAQLGLGPAGLGARAAIGEAGELDEVAAAAC